MIRYLKENGYPCDLELKAEQDGKWYYVSVFINGVEKPSLAYDTRYPIETRKAFAKGFFAGVKRRRRPHDLPEMRKRGNIGTI